jgi:hypothetical protein
MSEQYGYTPPTSPYPPFFNVTVEGDEVVVTVRAEPTAKEGVRLCGHDCIPGKEGCNNYCRHWPLGYVPNRPEPMTHYRCGASASMRMPLEEFRKLVQRV